MPTDTTTPPRRNWHFNRWLIVLIIATLGWSGWRAYAFRSALAEAKALGWRVEYIEPFGTIRAEWKLAFKKETWLGGVIYMVIPTSESFEQHLAIVHRLNPKALQIANAATLRDVSLLKSFSGLQGIWLYRCKGLTNVNALKNLRALQSVYLDGCKGLTNVDALKNLSALQGVVLEGCTGLTNVDALNNLSALQEVSLAGCAGLTNVDALKNLSALQTVFLKGCTGLTNVDGLKNLSALQRITLDGCTGLTKETVAALKAALPKAYISSDYK